MQYESPRQSRGEKGEKNFIERNSENYPKLEREMNIQIHESQRTPNTLSIESS
jgi:hypothetical protein